MSISFARLSANCFEIISCTGMGVNRGSPTYLYISGVGKFLRLDHHVKDIDRVMPVLRHGEVLHDVKHGESATIPCRCASRLLCARGATKSRPAPTMASTRRKLRLLSGFFAVQGEPPDPDRSAPGA